MLGNVAIDSSTRRRRLLFRIFVVTLLFNSTFVNAQVVVKVNDNINFRMGTLIQAWLDEAQDATTRGYVANLYLRRTRFVLGGQIAPNVTFFFQTDNPNLGKAPKALGAGRVLLDAWGEWKIRDEFMLDAGEFIIPLNRILLDAGSRRLTLDISPTATVATGALTQSNGNRDTGFEAKGYLIDGGRLEYRAALFSGVRDTASRNPFRKTGYLQYSFWEKERGYTYPETNLGKKKILAIATGYDWQKDYKAYSATLTAQVPMAGNEFAAVIQAVHYDGGTFLKTIPRQNDFVAEFGYYLAPLKIQPYVKFEEQKFATTVSAATTNQTREGVGANYYISGQNLKITGQFLHVVFKNSAINSTNEFTVQFQVWYY